MKKTKQGGAWYVTKAIDKAGYYVRAIVDDEGTNVPLYVSSRETGERIVRAVNAHDELVNALQLAREFVIMANAHYESAEPCLYEIDAALANAEGKGE